MRDADIEAVEQWLPALGVPPAPVPGLKDMRGVGVRVAKFDDQEALSFFFPRRSIVTHRAMIKVLVRVLRRRGAHLVSVTVTAEDYARWCEAYCNTDTAELRYQFASRPPRD